MEQSTDDGLTPMDIACDEGHTECVKVLSSYGALRDFPTSETAEQSAQAQGREATLAWLVSSRGWTSLHHVCVLSARRARALLRGGADLHADAPTGATPLSLAQAMRAAGNAPDGSAAHLVLRAAQPWSRETHALFPAAARARAVELLLLGHRLSREPRFESEAGAVVDVFVGFVMPFAVARQEQ